MIDRETAIQWAKDAVIGFFDYTGVTRVTKTFTDGSQAIEKIQALITRAQNEAYELAAVACDKFPASGYNCASYALADKIRELKHNS